MDANNQLALSDSALGAHSLFSQHDSIFVCAPTPFGLESTHGYRPLLLESLVDAQFRGTSYRAVNWIYLGETRGRGRMDRSHEAHGRAVKQIFVYPLCRNVHGRLIENRAEGRHDLKVKDHG